MSQKMMERVQYDKIKEKVNREKSISEKKNYKKKNYCLITVCDEMSCKTKNVIKKFFNINSCVNLYILKYMFVGPGFEVWYEKDANLEIGIWI